MDLVYTQIGFIDIYTGYLHYDIHVHTTLYMHSRAKKTCNKQKPYINSYWRDYIM